MKQISDDILIKALELREQGKSPEQIFAAFPEAKAEIKAYFKLVADLQAEAKKIVPPAREVLRGALRRAAAMREMSALPAAARFFKGMPLGMRILFPVLAVLVIVTLVNPSEVATPLPPAPGTDDQAVSVLSAPSANDTAEPPAMLAKAPTPTSPDQPAPPETTMMAASSEPATPADRADSIAAAYIAGAESEDTAMTGAAAEESAAQDDSQSAQYVAEPTSQ